MMVKHAKLVYFSPTGTSKTIIHTVAKGLNLPIVETVDITKPEARKETIQTDENELLLVAVPVYMGRVPHLINDWLQYIEAQNTPVVCIVVFGNRTYGDALLELNDILKECGCMPIAGAAFIGEHSFSSEEFPIADSRPNSDDLKQAFIFGEKVKEKLNVASSFENACYTEFPGSFPYGGITKLWSVDFISISEKCSNEGICADVCPTGAINFDNTRIIDHDKCISCCACIKSCPNQARSVKEGKVRDASIRLYTLFNEPKQPELFY